MTSRNNEPGSVLPQAAPAPRLFAVVLAAGSASRYGSVKQLAQFSGEALVVRALRSAERLCAGHSVLVTGHAGSEVRAACTPLQGFFVHNDRHAAGIGTSLACGIAAIREVADGALIVLADQPLVTDEHLARLLSLWQEQPARAVASRYRGAIGVPAILPASDFPALMSLDGDIGAKPLLLAHGTALLLEDCDAAAIDIDRPADLEALR